MRLSSPEFEKRFRAVYRSELKASSDLRKRSRQARKPRAGPSDTLRRIGFPVLAAMIFASFASKARSIEFGVALISLWAAGTAFKKGQQWFQTFYASDDLLALNLLPIGDREIFRIQSRKFARQFGWVFLEFFLLYFALGLVQEEWSPLLYLAPGVALLQTLLIFSVALHCVVFLHMVPLGPLAGLLRASAVFLLFAGPHMGEIVPYLVRFSYWFFPTGWINYGLVQAGFRQDWITLGLLLPVAAITYAGFYSWQRLRAFYSLEGFEIVPVPGAFALEGERSGRGVTEIHDSIGEGFFLRSVNWARAGWMERWMSNWLKGRDRVVLEFLVAENPRWTRSLKGSLWVFGFGAAVIYLFGQHSGFIVFFPAYLLATATLPLLGGEWRGLQQFPSGGVFLPAYALYPVTFKEITRVIFRVNVLRTLAATPLLLAFGLLAAWKLGHPISTGAHFTAKALALFLALQPVLILFPLSKSTNDSSRMRWLWYFGLFPMMLALFFLCLAAVFVQEPLPSLLLVVLVLVVSISFFAIYRWAFHAGRFDLLSTRLNSGQ